MRTGDDDIASPRYKHARTEANSVWETLGGKKIPVKLNDIVQALGIRVAEIDISADKHFDGGSEMDSDGNCTIKYRKSTSVERKRFTVAHELGHIVLGHISFDGSSTQYSGNSQEKEADAFAGALLVPVEDLRAFMKNGNQSIEDVMVRYWISRDVAVINVTSHRLINKLKVSEM